MKGVRLIAAALCALLVLAVPVMADGFGMGDFESDTVNKNPQVDNPKEVTPTPSTELPQEPTGDSTGSGTEDGAENGAGNTAANNTGNTGEPSHELDDGLWGDWSDPGNSGVRTELPSKEQQELQELLYELVTDGCKDDDNLNEFYDRITGAIETHENFVIFLAHNRYDVPGKTSDDLEMEDASEEVFSHILCAVCPVSLTEPGLGYSEECGTFESMVRNWTAHKPDYGFLFPAFNDRSADIHEMLFYNRSVKSLGDQAVLNFTGSGLPMAAEEQKDAVCKIAENLFQGELDYSMAMAVKEQIDQTIEERADMERAEEAELDKEKLKDLLERATGQPISDAEFNHAAQGVLDEGEKLCYENLSDTRTLELKTPTVTIKVKTNETGTPEVRKIDGRNCIVIPVEGELTVNGMKVETTKTN